MTYLYAFISIFICFVLTRLIINFFIKYSPSMIRKRYVKKMYDQGFKKNEFGHWVK